MAVFVNATVGVREGVFVSVGVLVGINVIVGVEDGVLVG